VVVSSSLEETETEELDGFTFGMATTDKVQYGTACQYRDAINQPSTSLARRTPRRDRKMREICIGRTGCSCTPLENAMTKRPMTNDVHAEKAERIPKRHCMSKDIAFARLAFYVSLRNVIIDSPIFARSKGRVGTVGSKN
jgi:hypothetical protein